MTEPPRLHMEPESELERSLLDAGRSYTASGSSRAKALAALGIVGVGTSTTMASAISKGAIVKWIATTALVAAVAVPTFRYLKQRAAAPGASVVAVPQAPSERAISAAPAPVASGDAQPDAPAPATDTATHAPPSPARTSEPKLAAPALSAELSALDAARSALASGNAVGALTSLDAYAHNFPHGKLSLEAEVLRIDALAKSGQTAAASKRATAFIKRHPDSVLASRVRAYAEQ